MRREPNSLTCVKHRRMSYDPSPDHAETDRSALADQAARCRRLADALTDRQTIDTLNSLAREYDERADGDSNTN